MYIYGKSLPPLQVMYRTASQIEVKGSFMEPLLISLTEKPNHQESSNRLGSR